jgi:hypothetical protein
VDHREAPLAAPFEEAGHRRHAAASLGDPVRAAHARDVFLLHDDHQQGGAVCSQREGRLALPVLPSGEGFQLGVGEVG